MHDVETDGGADAQAVGRTRTVGERIGSAPSERLLDLLGRPSGLKEGDALPPLGHWLHFHGSEPIDRAGHDGHPRRGGFLPALLHLPRRMWAGSDVTFHAPLRAGEKAQKRMVIEAVDAKSGRSGPLAFVRLRHEITADGEPRITDVQTLVFREAPPEGAAGRTRRMAAADVARSTWGRDVTPGAVSLFRYSALTWNSHRIHYDADYARDAEGYPAPVIHGPLLATWLADLASERGTLARFAFRARAPLFLGDTVVLEGEEVAGGAKLVARAAATAMEADAVYA